MFIVWENHVAKINCEILSNRLFLSQHLNLVTIRDCEQLIFPENPQV